MQIVKPPNRIILRRPPLRRGVDELLSDYFREASVLILVFGFLDPVFTRGDTVFRWWYYVGILASSVFTFTVGYGCERRRK